MIAFIERVLIEMWETLRDMIARQLLRLGFVCARVPYIGKSVSRMVVTFVCYLGSADFATWLAVASALGRHSTELWINVAPTDEVTIRIVDSELGTYDLFFADKSAPYARASLRMMWVYSIIRAKHSTVPISTEERVVVNETLNIPIIPARFVIPRVSEMYWDTIPTDGVI